jgi:penicillin amidase
LKRIVATVLVIGIIAIALAFHLLRASLPLLDGDVALAGLSAKATLEIDPLGIPRITAATRQDAFLILGYATARDRLFQLDLMRRSSSGRLAEVLGPKLLEKDRWHRVVGFSQVAAAILPLLDAEQRAVLDAYRDGVNLAIAQYSILPFEFLLLGYKPEPWRSEDSLLVILRMYEMLSWSGDEERMATLLRAALPVSVVRFLTPSLDRSTAALLGLQEEYEANRRLPLEDLKALRPLALARGLAQPAPPEFGSNAWVIGPTKTRANVAMLANDTHLQLALPNIWYRAELRYGDTRLIGLTIPGIPSLVIGTNEYIAWGFTNVQGDFSDLVTLAIDPADADQYLTPDGYERIQDRRETIRVRGQADDAMTVRTTRWGPILPQTLDGRPLALRWIALDPGATNLRLIDLDQIRSVQDALPVLNRVGAPPQNAMIADRAGNIGWTYMGKVPRRVGFSGLFSESWADGTRRWDGYVLPEDLPRAINPPEGALVTANQRTYAQSPFVVGSNFSSGQRAFRIVQRLRELASVDESDMLKLQTDTEAAYYAYYHELALRLLDGEPGRRHAPLREYLAAWDGQAAASSLAFPVLMEFRTALIDRVFSPLLHGCRARDEQFIYAWRTVDVPLQALLDARIPELLPDPKRYANWDAFLTDILIETADRLAGASASDSLATLAWGSINTVDIAHPFALIAPGLRSLLAMPQVALSGCSQCVRVSSPRNGVSERLVVAPGRASDGVLHMPGGQSGHPLSPHFSDQQSAWVDGTPLPLTLRTVAHRLNLFPQPVTPR